MRLILPKKEGKFAIIGAGISESNCLFNQDTKCTRRISRSLPLKLISKNKSIKVKSDKWTLDPPHFDWWHQHSQAGKKKEFGSHHWVSDTCQIVPALVSHLRQHCLQALILSTSWECDHPPTFDASSLIK